MVVLDQGDHIQPCNNHMVSDGNYLLNSRGKSAPDFSFKCFLFIYYTVYSRNSPRQSVHNPTYKLRKDQKIIENDVMKKDYKSYGCTLVEKMALKLRSEIEGQELIVENKREKYMLLSRTHCNNLTATCNPRKGRGKIQEKKI